MQPRCFQRVSAWLDDGSSEGRILSLALDWAFRLNLPLRVIATSSSVASLSATTVYPRDRWIESGSPVMQKMKAWSAECAQRGVVMETNFSHEGGEAGMDQFLRPGGLCVFGENTASNTPEELLQRSARDPEIAVLLCPPTCVPMARIMVLCHQSSLNGTYLESAVRLCQALEIPTVILIVANTEREAQLRQGYAEGVCHSFRLQADFDFVVGCDLRSAVSRVASWRSCSHLIIERQNAVSWWPGWNTDLLDQLRRLSEPLSILALPEATVFEVPPKIRGCSANLLRSGFTGTQMIHP